MPATDAKSELSMAESDFNNNDPNRRNSISEYSETQDSYLARLSESHGKTHGRRRSSLAALNTRNLKKNPAISGLLKKINEAQQKYRKC